MLEQIDLTKKMTKEAYQEGIDSLKERLRPAERVQKPGDSGHTCF